MPAKKQILKPLQPVQHGASEAYFYRALNMHGLESIVAAYRECYHAPDSAALLDHHYQTWLTEQGLPQWSADDLMFSQAPDVPQVNKAQGDYLKWFILVWECVNNP